MTGDNKHGAHVVDGQAFLQQCAKLNRQINEVRRSLSLLTTEALETRCCALNPLIEALARFDDQLRQTREGAIFIGNGVRNLKVEGNF